ncbi:MAG: ATP-binding cassette domain-containing protein, partial [Lentisphaeria bacterium]|nr:ATP-binding cassette domain-containing protein [Lentisphaeria bacterium]
MALLEVNDLAVYYPLKKGLFGRKQYLKAVDGVSFHIDRGEIVGLVGESGCGKSTIGRALVKLEEPTRGRIILDGVDLSTVKGKNLRLLRRKFQMIFQDPYGSLNPRMTVFNALDEVISLHTELTKEERYAKAVELLELVGLPP